MKKIVIGILISIVVLLINYTNSIGASSTTYLYLDSIKIEDSNIEMLSNEIYIDTTTSKIENTINLKNTSDKEIEMNLDIPLENEKLNISIKDLTIKLNGVQVEYVKDEKENYIIKTKISANSGKKINIEYYTENDLQKAKLIKCNFENLKGKKVGKLKVDIKIDDKNIPLVEKIYPGHYTIKDNILSVEYYNYEVNTLTKDVIVKKETFNNLLYGREITLCDEEKDIINSWYSTGDLNINKEEFESDYNKKYNSEGNENNQTINSIVKNIIDYSYIKKGKIIGQYNYINYEPSEPLLYEMYEGNPNAEMKWDLKGKNICIDFVETEGDKELYVEKVTNIQNDTDSPMPLITTELVKETERNILQTKGVNTGYQGKRGAKIIFVGQGIEGESLNATEQEKISYINQINADMYIRVEIYDGNAIPNDLEWGNESGWVGYYDNNNLEIAKTFIIEGPKIKRENWRGQYEKYQTYDEYVKNYKNDYCKNVLIKLDNEDISNKCEIPTVVQFIGNRETKEGKYVVNYSYYGFYDNGGRGLITTNAALQTSQAKKMLASNKQKNNNTKSEIENEITNLLIVDDEQKIQQSIKAKIEELKMQEELKRTKAEEEVKAKEKEEQQKILIKHILIFFSIGLGIAICVVIIIREQKKKNNIKKESVNNGKKGTDEN